jgi:predicted amidohydrolase
MGYTMRNWLLFLLASALAPAGTLFEQSSFAPGPDGAPAGWRLWIPHEGSAPKAFVDTATFRSAPDSLALSAKGDVDALGGWERQIDRIQPGQWYRFVAYYRTDGTEYARRQVVPRLDWVTADGKRSGKPDYPYQLASEGGWKRVSLDAPAPRDAAAVKLQLSLWASRGGTVWWDDVSLTPIAAPKPRPVTVAAINLRPRNTASPEENVRLFVEVIDRTVPPNTDLILLPEGMTIVGTGKKIAAVAEPVPGPTTERLGETARKHNAYVAAGIYERDGPGLYNTAVLIDRAGRFVGKYRKVYIPREETEGGLLPGYDYPVFETDFGKVGMMICWDVQYPDPARGLALRGAEIILMPIWGGNVTLAKARAIENHLFLVTSGYDYPTHVIDPNGKILATAAGDGAAAIATVDLNKRYVDGWLGHMRSRFMKELRLDVPVEPSGLW